MKQLILTTLLFFVATKSFAQQDTIFVRYPDNSADELTYLTDTVLQEYGIAHPYLVGTCKIPGSATQIYAMGNGVYFDKVTKSACKATGDEVYRDSTHINSYELTDKTLTVDMTFIDNCCFEFLCDIDLDEKGILHLRYTGYGSLCGCMCCFGVVYHFDLDRELEDFNLKGIMYEDDEKTLIRFN